MSSVDGKSASPVQIDNTHLTWYSACWKGYSPSSSHRGMYVYKVEKFCFHLRITPVSSDKKREGGYIPSSKDDAVHSFLLAINELPVPSILTAGAISGRAHWYTLFTWRQVHRNVLSWRSSTVLMGCINTLNFHWLAHLVGPSSDWLRQLESRPAYTWRHALLQL